jgi:hypothetical protein
MQMVAALARFRLALDVFYICGKWVRTQLDGLVVPAIVPRHDRTELLDTLQ